MKTLAEKIEVMTAFGNGKKIELKSNTDSSWSCTVTPNWNWAGYDYRVFREPRRIWVNFHNDMNDFAYSTKENAILRVAPGAKESAVEFVEVMK